MRQSAIRFDSLERIPERVLYEAFLDAFSDYEIPITATLDDFLAMHRRRGISYEASVGAFDDSAGGKLAAFIFNGDGRWMGGRCAYDGGTGVSPTHRGRGLSKALAGEAGGRLREAGFDRWLLEVLVGNDKAIRTYQGAGFRTTRRFSCPEGAIPDAPGRAPGAAARTRVAIRDLGHRDTARFAAWRSWEPSWQNSDESARRTPETLIALGAYRDGASGPAGFILATEKGSVFQLAVAPGERRRGVGRTLILALAARTPGGAVRCINVQSDDAATLGLLSSLGLESRHDQWEMALELRPSGPDIVNEQ